MLTYAADFYHTGNFIFIRLLHGVFSTQDVGNATNFKRMHSQRVIQRNKLTDREGTGRQIRSTALDPR